MDVAWKFLNGTDNYNTCKLSILQLETKLTESGFWAIYPANLNIADLLRPNGYDGTNR